MFVNGILLDVHWCNEDARNLVSLCKWEGKTIAIMDKFEMNFLRRSGCSDVPL
jgi:hypothetical protein